MRLLWRHAAAPHDGPHSRSDLTVDRIVDTALAVADAHGLAALTMRRIAGELDVSAMTPYSYVPGKYELLALMLDTVYARMDLRLGPKQDWRARVTAVADSNRALHRAHPWTLHTPTVRPLPGPGMLAKYDRELAAFEGIGLHDVEMDAALAHLLALVRASVLAEMEAAEAERDSGTDAAGWWDTVAPLLAEVIDPTTYPRASRVGTAAGRAHEAPYDPDHVYAFGLARFLDGLAALVDRRPS